MIERDLVAAITGATGNLGSVVARSLATQGVRLALFGTNAERLEHLASGLDLPDDRLLTGALDGSLPAVIEAKIQNVQRSVGAAVSGEIARRHGQAGLGEDMLTARLAGSAGQSFGAFLARGVVLDLAGEANDYVGKGLSGGRLIVRQPVSSRKAAANIIVGNTCLTRH